MKRIIIHIGLPKTATTSIQKHVFEAEDGSRWDYVGVRQSRNRDQSELYERFMKCTACLKADFDENCSKFNALISAMENDMPMLISEEMFVVDQEISWQEKLSRLQKITQSLEVSILVTVRDPARAAYSLYVESYSLISEEYPTFDDFFKESNQSKIFNYKLLFSRLDELFDKKNILVVPFELLRRGQFSSEIVKSLGFSFDVVDLPNENTKKHNSHGEMTRPVSLKTWTEKVLKGNRKFARYYIALALKLLRLSRDQIRCPWGRKLIPYPDFNETSKCFADSNKWFFEHYSIDYMNHD